ncbi:MAG TPA: hypothetical protein VIF62_21770 [Labilithrix sp.]|jgi:hypothetical protein
MRSTSFLLLSLSSILAAACSSRVIGTGKPAAQQSTSPVQATPGEGEPCTCTSTFPDAPTVDCCQGDLVCGQSTSPPTCNPGEKTCSRTGTCVQWYEDDPRTSTPPPLRNTGETCDPLANQCAPGTTCELDAIDPTYWRCSDGSATDECVPFEGGCPDGTVCQEVDGHYRCGP